MSPIDWIHWFFTICSLVQPAEGWKVKVHELSLRFSFSTLMCGILGEVLCGKSHLRPDWSRHLKSGFPQLPPSLYSPSPSNSRIIRLFAIFQYYALILFKYHPRMHLMKIDDWSLLTYLRNSICVISQIWCNNNNKNKQYRKVVIKQY